MHKPQMCDTRQEKTQAIICSRHVDDGHKVNKGAAGNYLRLRHGAQCRVTAPASSRGVSSVPAQIKPEIANILSCQC